MFRSNSKAHECEWTLALKVDLSPFTPTSFYAYERVILAVFQSPSDAKNLYSYWEIELHVVILPVWQSLHKQGSMVVIVHRRKCAEQLSSPMTHEDLPELALRQVLCQVLTGHVQPARIE